MRVRAQTPSATLFGRSCGNTSRHTFGTDAFIDLRPVYALPIVDRFVTIPLSSFLDRTSLIRASDAVFNPRLNDAPSPIAATRYYDALQLSIELDREDGGRWIAKIPSRPGVMAYGAARDRAIAAVERLAVEVIADCIAHRVL
jgi:predicted RNase H-like HicB family nuclease